MSERKKPDWWPTNPYPESVFPMKEEDYPSVVPDEKKRTALSGMLGRMFWETASNSIWEAFNESSALAGVEEPEETMGEVKTFLKRKTKERTTISSRGYEGEERTSDATVAEALLEKMGET